MNTRKTYAEGCGAGLGTALIEALHKLRDKPQSESFLMVAGALGVLTLFDEEHIESAAAGFAGALVDVLMVGIANLPTEGVQ